MIIIKKYIPEIILIDTLLLILVFMLSQLLLTIFDLSFRKWAIAVFVMFITLGLVIGTYQLLLRIRNRSLKIFLASLYTVFVLAAGSFVLPVALFAFAGKEHVVERNEGKYVAYVNGFLDTYVQYYDYKNFLICGKNKRIEEYYGKGGFDPIENPYGYKYEVVSTIYFDENGEEN